MDSDEAVIDYDSYVEDFEQFAREQSSSGLLTTSVLKKAYQALHDANAYPVPPPLPPPSGYDHFLMKLYWESYFQSAAAKAEIIKLAEEMMGDATSGD